MALDKISTNPPVTPSLRITKMTLAERLVHPAFLSALIVVVVFMALWYFFWKYFFFGKTSGGPTHAEQLIIRRAVEKISIRCPGTVVNHYKHHLIDTPPGRVYKYPRRDDQNTEYFQEITLDRHELRSLCKREYAAKFPEHEEDRDVMRLVHHYKIQARISRDQYYAATDEAHRVVVTVHPFVRMFFHKTKLEDLNAERLEE